MMGLVFSERIEILRPRIVSDGYGGELEDWDTPTVIVVSAPVSVQQVATEESNSSTSQLVHTRWRLYSQPPQVLEELQPNDRIRVIGGIGGTWVIGDPEHWRGPLLPHTEVDLEVYRGADRN